jgi:hypothetical protein
MLYFGGKSRIAATVWKRLGSKKIENYVEPFAGSAAVLLARPRPFSGIETINDIDGLLANFWRSVQAEPETVARYADWPVFEVDLHARHAWLVGRKKSMQSRLEGDPEWYDPRAAGWWCWGLCCKLGGGWCEGSGPWEVVDGELVKIDRKEKKEGKRTRAGINRDFSITYQTGVARPKIKRPRIGISRSIPAITAAERHIAGGVSKSEIRATDVNPNIVQWMRALCNRLVNVRVCTGDWSRVCTPAVTTGLGLTGIFLDPPYGEAAERCETVYANEDLQVATAVREWCLENGNNPNLRIVLAGYQGEHEALEKKGWDVINWKAQGGYANQSDDNQNRHRERLWCSPKCQEDENLFKRLKVV